MRRRCCRGSGGTVFWVCAETEVLPAKQVSVEWGGRVFGGTTFVERFEVVDASARTIARFEDGTPAAFERAVGKGRAIILGTFAGERNATDPVAMNPLGDLLVEWAGLDKPDLTASGFVELKRLAGAAGELVLLLNHGEQAARVELELRLGRASRGIRELVTGTAAVPGVAGAGTEAFRLVAEIPAAGRACTESIIEEGTRLHTRWKRICRRFRSRRRA